LGYYGKDADHEAVLNLNCPDGPVELRENYGFSLSALSRIAKFLQAEIKTACDQWGHIYGHF
jgi:hypothetical protein